MIHSTAGVKDITGPTLAVYLWLFQKAQEVEGFVIAQSPALQEALSQPGPLQAQVPLLREAPP